MFNSLFRSDDDIEARYESQNPEPSLLDRARSGLGLGPPTRREMAAEAMCPDLTFRQRLYGFGICFALGCLVSLGSMMYFHRLLAGQPTPFAVNYTVGNLVALSSTFFLVGPARQLKRMSSATRCGAAFVYVSSMAATLVCALVLPRVTKLPSSAIAGLVVACIVVQFCAMFWYALSYVPYGRRMFRACCASMAEDG